MTLAKCKTNFNRMYISTSFSLLPELFSFFSNSEALNTSQPQAKLCFNVEGWVLHLSVHLTLMHFCKQYFFFFSFSVFVSMRGSISWHTYCKKCAVMQLTHAAHRQTSPDRNSDHVFDYDRGTVNLKPFTVALSLLRGKVLSPLQTSDRNKTGKKAEVSI